MSYQLLDRLKFATYVYGSQRMNCDVIMLMIPINSNHCCFTVQSHRSEEYQLSPGASHFFLYIYNVAGAVQSYLYLSFAPFNCVLWFPFIYPMDISQGPLHCFAGIKIHRRLYLLQHCRTMQGDVGVSLSRPSKMAAHPF